MRLPLRPRRLRGSPAIRSMVRETRLHPADLVYPIFVKDGITEPEAIESMPGIHRWPVRGAVDEAGAAASVGIPAVLLFGIPSFKDAAGTGAFAADGVVQRAVTEIKSAHPGLLVVTDACLCEYTDHGHCGLLRQGGEGDLLNDETLEVLRRIAVSQARAGADVVAPSGMIDGMVGAIREALDGAGFDHLPILSYAAKYASALYGPFREAAEGAPKHGDRRTHQMDPANAREALREVALDIAEGADLVMVKPATPFLDVIRQIRDRFPEVPLAAYNVSGEYAMVKAAAASGWIDERATVLELLAGIRRAGADLVITYHAKDVAGWLRG